MVKEPSTLMTNQGFLFPLKQHTIPMWTHSVQSALWTHHTHNIKHHIPFLITAQQSSTS